MPQTPAIAFAAFAVVLLVCGAACKPSSSLSSSPPSSSASASASASASSSTPWDADFAAEVARAPMPTLPDGVTVAITCCLATGRADKPVFASVEVLLPPPDDAPSSPRPSAPAGDSYVIDMTKTPNIILGRPDFAAVRRTVPQRAKDAMAAYAIGHAKLITLDGYKSWRHEGFTYTSLMQNDATDKSIWTIYFHSATYPNPTIQINVNITTNTVLDTSNH